jgi:hypothetical protein
MEIASRFSENVNHVRLPPAIKQTIGFVEVLDGGLDSVVKLEEFTKSTVIVKDIHHLINTRASNISSQ